MKKTLFFSILAMLITFAAKAQTQTRHVYVDEKTDSHSHLATQIEADASDKVNITSLSEGWYYVENMTATLENELTIYGNVVLILGNSGNLTITGGINIPAGSSLTIYDGTYYAAGAFQGGELVIQDEDMTVDGALIINSASLFKVDVNITGSGSVRINNGKVEIQSMGVSSDDVCFVDVSILGGQVNVNYIKADNLTLGYKTEKDQITISGCDVASASVADGCGYMLDDGSLIQGALEDGQMDNLAMKQLKQPAVPLPDGITDISEIANSITLKTNLPYTSEPQLLAEYDQIDIEYGKLVFFVADEYYNGDWADEPMATAIGTYTVSYKIESTSPIFKDSDSQELTGTASIVAKDGVTFTDNTIKYYIYDETNKYVEVIGWEDENYNAGSDIDITIPATVSKDDVVYKVRKIRDKAFSRLKGQYTTYGYLNNVTFATGNNIISIGDKAFYNNKLSSINLEACNNLTTIGEEAFGYCENLESIIIPDGVTELADQLFMTSGRLKSVTFSKVTKIGTGVFKETSLESVNLDGVTEIGGAAFNQSKLTNLTIPKSVKSIGGEAFSSCSYLKSITIEANGSLTEIQGSTFNGAGNEAANESSGRFGDYLTVVVPSNITKIGDNAFASAAIKKITFEEGVTTFGNGVFAYISGMNGFSGLDIEIKAANPTLGDAPFGDSDFYVENAKEKGSTLTISPCADKDAIKEAWGDYFDDDKIIGGFTLDETLLPDAFKKEYDGNNEISFESNEPIIGTGYSIALHSATLWDANNMPSPTVGKDKTVKINYDITLSGATDACRTGATTKLKTSTPGSITITKKITIYPNSNENIAIEGVTSDPGTFTELNGSTKVSATYQNDNQFNVQANDGTPSGEYTLTSNDGTVTIIATVPASYAVFENNTLTFKFGVKSSESSTLVYDLPTDNTTTPGWLGTWATSIQKVVFDPSFDVARPVTCYKWFTNCENLTEITGMEYLHTDKVTDMSYMFNHCEALQMVDLSKFNTSNVTNMESMFAGCIKMRMLDLTSFNTENVINMEWMFNLNATQAMYSTSLEVIYVGDGWKTDQVTSHENMFFHNDKLEGGNGTKFDDSKVRDKTFAKIDGGNTDPGYLTGIANYGYAVLNGNTLTFKQGSKPAVVDGELFELTQSMMTFEYNGNNRTDVRPAWYNKRADIQYVVFDDGFQDVIVRNCNYWFDGCTNLTSITNLTKLNTSQVTEMRYMFSDCAKLGTIDLSGFHTENAHDFRGMFQGCTSLKSLNVSSITFNLDKYPNIVNDVENNNRIDVDAMFAKSGLESIDLSSWSSTPLSRYTALFQDCKNLKSVKVRRGIVTADTKYIDYMFSGCSNLGTDSEHPLDVSSFVTDNVTNMSYLFHGCTGLPSIDVSNFNTENVTNMSYMFDDCSSLSVLDISNFNTGNVTNMNFMFADCHNLTTIKVGSNWNTGNVTSSDNMFQGDYNLIGNYGAMVDVSKYNSYTNDVAKANCTEQDGYLTSGKYKIFYDLDKDDDELVLVSVDQLDIQSGTASTEYAGGSVVSLPTLKARDDESKDAFKGWHRATQDSEGNMKFATNASSAIADNEVGNRIYAAEWTFTKGKYVLYDVDTKTLTFHFDTKKPKTGAYTLNEGAVAPNWLEKSGEIEKVIIADPIKPTSCYQWFKGFNKLTALDLRNLKTSNVTNMTSMFYGCSNLTGILIGDNWSTDKVTESENMFTDCTSLIGEGGEFASQYRYEDKTYAYAGDGYSGYGYLTKDNFKIFYTLNDIEENGDDGNATFSNGSVDNSMIVPCSDDKATTLETPTWTNHIFSGWSKATAYIYNSESGSYDYVYDTEEPLHQKSVSPSSGNWAMMGLWDKNHSITLPEGDWELTDEFERALPKDSNGKPTAPKGATIIIKYKGTKVVKEVKVETN